MADLKTLVEREMDRAGEPTFAFEDLDGLRVRRHRTRQLTATAVGLGLVLAIALLGASLYQSARVPADPPDEPAVDLGIFEPLAGKIVYWSNGSLWGVHPNASSPASTLVRLGAEGRFASFTVPLGWSSDGTKLLFAREDPNEAFDAFQVWDHLAILHADGTETQVVPGPVEDAAISPDGSQVAFVTDGLYVVDAERGQPVLIAGEGNSPTFSPDGTQIAYLGNLRSARGITGSREDVWVANSDGTDAHEILADEPILNEGVFELEWSPAGDRIAMENSLENRVAIYTFAPDGSHFTEVITGGFNAHWSPDGTQIAYGVPGHDGLSIADADGSNVRTLSVGGPGPWHPGTAVAEGVDVLDPTSSRFVGGWAAIDYDDRFLGDDTTPYQTMTIRAGEDGVLHVTVHDDSACVPDATAQTMTGTGRLEDPTTLVVPAPDLTCVQGSIEASDRVELLDGYTLVIDPATDRLYDSLGVVWNRGGPAESRTGASTEAGVDGPGTYSILYREVAFRAVEPWNDHLEAYIDPRTFFLIGPGDAEMTILVNPLPPEAPCGPRVPPSSEELVQAVRSNPDLEATAPVVEPVGGIEALRMDVVAAPGASVGPCTGADEVDVVSVPGRPWANVGPGELGRLYLLDLPGGSARTLAIWITAPSSAVLEQTLDAAAPVLDSFEFRAP